MATTLGTLEGALQAGADQQQSQGAEQGRLADLETENGQATGNLQVQEVSNEVALFTAQEEMKQRNATNGTLNALLNRTSGDWHRGHLLLHRQLLDSAIEQ